MGSLVLGPKTEPDRWEIQPDQLLLQSVLGEGAFGLVRKGWLRDVKGNSGSEVAVKMLKGKIKLNYFDTFNKNLA